ncbi:hypothetical protein IFR05_008523 [Cadophora sp. M221]|nr:hypothetical protein IFR05_008523 [Cadophora sp. M221]
MAYNGLNALGFEEQLAKAEITMPTIEFRQHEGRLDGERITKPEREDVLKMEEKVANASAQFESYPIPIESMLTIIDLLKWLGLHDQELYYGDRLFPVVCTRIAGDGEASD